MLTALGFGMSYLGSSMLYINGREVESHALAALNGSLLSAACLFNGISRQKFFWYAASIGAMYFTMQDFVLLSNAKKDHAQMLTFHKAPKGVQRAHISTRSGPVSDMPDENQFRRTSTTAEEFASDPSPSDIPVNQTPDDTTDQL